MLISTLLRNTAEDLYKIGRTSNNDAQKKEANRLAKIIKDRIPDIVDAELEDSTDFCNKISDGLVKAGKTAVQADQQLKRVADRIGTTAEVIETAAEIIVAIGLIMA